MVEEFGPHSVYSLSSQNFSGHIIALKPYLGTFKSYLVCFVFLYSCPKYIQDELFFFSAQYLLVLHFLWIILHRVCDRIHRNLFLLLDCPFSEFTHKLNALQSPNWHFISYISSLFLSPYDDSSMKIVCFLLHQAQ